MDFSYPQSVKNKINFLFPYVAHCNWYSTLAVRTGSHPQVIRRFSEKYYAFQDLLKRSMADDNPLRGNNEKFKRTIACLVVPLSNLSDGESSSYSFVIEQVLPASKLRRMSLVIEYEAPLQPFCNIFPQ